MRRLLLVLSILVIIGCSPVQPAVLMSPQPVEQKEEVPVVQIPIETPSEPPTLLVPNSYERDQYPKFNILLYGVDKDYAESIVYSINPEYYEGLREIKIIYSKQHMLPGEGYYYQDSYSIMLYDVPRYDFLKYNLLHELKHHYCWYVKRQSSADHQGCFLNTPIDEEYGEIA
jgi:hypothetical protein